MGVSLSAKKQPEKVLDLGYFGFSRLRETVSDLVGEPWASHYRTLTSSECHPHEFFEAFDKETEQLIRKRKISKKVADFLLQVDVEGSIQYGACKELLKVIGDYDDNIAYGYVGKKDCVRFCDFKSVLQECVRKKCPMNWS